MGGIIWDFVCFQLPKEIHVIKASNQSLEKVRNRWKSKATLKYLKTLRRVNFKTN